MGTRRVRVAVLGGVIVLLVVGLISGQVLGRSSPSPYSFGGPVRSDPGGTAIAAVAVRAGDVGDFSANVENLGHSPAVLISARLITLKGYRTPSLVGVDLTDGRGKFGCTCYWPPRDRIRDNERPIRGQVLVPNKSLPPSRRQAGQTVTYGIQLPEGARTAVAGGVVLTYREGGKTRQAAAWAVGIVCDPWTKACSTTIPNTVTDMVNRLGAPH